MKENKNLIAAIIVAIAIIIAGVLISNALIEGLANLRETISFVGQNISS